VERYRTDFAAGLELAKSQLARLQVATRGDAEQRRTLEQLALEFERREAQYAQALAEYATGGTAAVTRLAADPQFTRSSTHARELLEELLTRERARFDALEAQDRRRQDQVVWWVTAFFALAVLIALLLSLLLMRELRAAARAERHIRWQQQFADAIIEHLPVLLYIKDAATLKLIRVNKAVERLIGKPREEMLDKDDRQFFPPHIAEAYIANERRFVDEHGGEMVEEVPVDTLGGRRILSVRKVVLDDENGRPAYLIGTSSDITDRLDSERRLRQFSNELAEKTRALETANRELEGFSYSVSHDLRAPLRAVDGYAAILEEDYADRFDDEGRRYLRAVRDGAGRMAQLIQDLLTFSRLSRHELTPHRTGTRGLVEAAWQQVLSASPGITAQLQIADVPDSHGDPRLLTQVWANLLDNAAKYSARAQEPCIRISGHVEKGEALFCVEDNGAGFDMRYYDKLFQVFQRLHRESEYPGTGVGLAIVQRIVARHGGRVWAESAIGSGARFSFSLPAA
jgi:PAS domain S-box-containing protein